MSIKLVTYAIISVLCFFSLLLWLSRTNGIFMLNDNRRYRHTHVGVCQAKRGKTLSMLPLPLLLLLLLPSFSMWNRFLSESLAPNWWRCMSSCVWIIDVNISMVAEDVIETKNGLFMLLSQLKRAVNETIRRNLNLFDFFATSYWEEDKFPWNFSNRITFESIKEGRKTGG